MAVVLMDVDGTLLPNPSCESRFITYLARRGKLGPTQLVSALLFYARYWPRFGKHVGRKNKAYLHRLQVDRIERLGRHFVDEQILPLLRPDVLGRLRAHQRAGDRVMLLTGAPTFLAQPLAQALGVSGWLGTQCARAGARFHWAPPLRHPLGREKVQAARSLCAQEQTELAQAVAYADSIHDVPLLEQVAQAVAVHPDRGLRRVARERGWECLDTRSAPATLGVSK